MPRRPDERRTYRKETRLIHGDYQSPHWDYRDHIIPPMTTSAAYRLERAERGAAGFQAYANPEFNRDTQAPIYIYDRLAEPSRSMLEHNLALAEDGETALCFGSGMAAISAALGVLVKTGDRILAHRTLYGCTFSLLTNWWPRFGVGADLIDFKDLAAFERALTDDVMVVYLETPTNPTLEILDLRAIRAVVDKVNAQRGKRRKIFVVVDNTFASPYCQRPLSLGADIVVHSLTKNIGGFGTDIGGVVIAPRLLEPDLLLFRKDFGAPLSPKASWTHLVHGLPTLALRSRRQMETALQVARFLETRPEVARVLYPGLPSHPQHEIAKRQMVDPEGNFAPGTLIYFVLRGTPEEAKDSGRRLINWLADNAYTITLAVSLGQVRTLIEHPGSMTHSAIPAEKQLEAGLDPGGVRLALGLEAPADLIADLTDGFASLSASAA